MERTSPPLSTRSGPDPVRSRDEMAWRIACRVPTRSTGSNFEQVDASRRSSLERRQAAPGTSLQDAGSQHVHDRTTSACRVVQADSGLRIALHRDNELQAGVQRAARVRVLRTLSQDVLERVPKPHRPLSDQYLLYPCPQVPRLGTFLRLPIVGSSLQVGTSTTCAT